MKQHIENLIAEFKNDLITESAFTEQIADIVNETNSLNTLALIRELIIESGLLSPRIAEDLDEAIFDRVAPLIQVK